MNALLHIDRTKESVDTPKVTNCLATAKSQRKLIIRYIQLVEGQDDVVGTLLSTNESLLNAISAYDRFIKPIDLDSDSLDEMDEEEARMSQRDGLRIPDSDTTSIRSRLSAFELKDNELDKVQDRQRSRLERSNRERAHPDLQDLMFLG